jgi:hypothetical protein
MKQVLLMIAVVALVGCGELKKEADGITDRFDKRGMIDSGLLHTCSVTLHNNCHKGCG